MPPRPPAHVRPLPRAPSCRAVNEDGTPANIFSGVTDELLAVLITIERFWRPALINSVLPVCLVFLLGMFVFCTEETELATRLEIVVTLFLALTGEALGRGRGRMEGQP